MGFTAFIGIAMGLMVASLATSLIVINHNESPSRNCALWRPCLRNVPSSCSTATVLRTLSANCRGCPGSAIGARCIPTIREAFP